MSPKRPHPANNSQAPARKAARTSVRDSDGRGSPAPRQSSRTRGHHRSDTSNLSGLTESTQRSASSYAPSEVLSPAPVPRWPLNGSSGNRDSTAQNVVTAGMQSGAGATQRAIGNSDANEPGIEASDTSTGFEQPTSDNAGRTAARNSSDVQSYDNGTDDTSQNDVNNFQLRSDDEPARNGSSHGDSEHRSGARRTADSDRSNGGSDDPQAMGSEPPVLSTNDQTMNAASLPNADNPQSEVSSRHGDTSPFAPTQPNDRSPDIDLLDNEAQNGSGPGDDTSRQISDDTVAETGGSDEELARQLDSESVRSRGGSSGRGLPGAPHSADGGSVFGMYGGHINFSNCKFKEVILMTFDARRFGDQTRKSE